jgi:hypothetical protein
VYCAGVCTRGKTRSSTVRFSESLDNTAPNLSGVCINGETVVLDEPTLLWVAHAG